MLSSFGFWDQGGGALPLVSPGPSCVMDGPADTSDGAPVVCLGGSNNCGTNYAGYLAGSRRRDCHFDDTPCLSLLKHLLKVRGAAIKMTALYPSRVLPYPTTIDSIMLLIESRRRLPSGGSLPDGVRRRGPDGRLRDCHSAAPPSTFSRYFNRDQKGVSSE